MHRRLCDMLLALPHPRGGQLDERNCCVDCGHVNASRLEVVDGEHRESPHDEYEIHMRPRVALDANAAAELQAVLDRAARRLAKSLTNEGS